MPAALPGRQPAPPPPELGKILAMVFLYQVAVAVVTLLASSVLRDFRFVSPFQQ